MMDPSTPSLYQRMGGHDRLAAFIEDLMPRLTADPTLWVYWKGKSHDSFRKEKQLLLEFLCTALGGPGSYTGRDMKSSHAGLGITEAEWNIFAGHAVAALDACGFRDPETGEFLACATSLMAEIVEVPKG